MQVLCSDFWLGSRELRRTCALGSGLTKKDLRLSMMAAFWICVRGKPSAMVVLYCVELQQWPQPSVPWVELALRGLAGGAQCAVEGESCGCLAAPSQSRVVPSGDRGDGGQRGWWWCRAGVWRGMTLAEGARLVWMGFGHLHPMHVLYVSESGSRPHFQLFSTGPGDNIYLGDSISAVELISYKQEFIVANSP